MRNCESGEVWVFPCNTWLASDEGNRQIDKVFTAPGSLTNYSINVRTGTPDRSGTDANIRIRMFGTRTDSGDISLPEETMRDVYEPNFPVEHVLFETGYVDAFTAPLPDLGDIQTIGVYHDNAYSGAGWFLDYITIRNDRTGTEWYFPCHNWLAVDEGDGMTYRALSASPPVTTYCVSVKTGDRDHAGTNANVYLTLYGTEGRSAEELLNHLDVDDFEKGSVGYFNVAAKGIGDLQQIRIRHDNTGSDPGWFLEEITVRNTETGTRWYLPCHNWLAVDEGDGATDRTLRVSPPLTTYCISVKTGDRDHAGTNANVYLTLYGTEGHSGEKLLNNPNVDDFEKGSVGYFNIATEGVGELQQIRIRHDNTGDDPGWFLEEIFVQNCDEHRQWYFLCGRWLARDEPPRRIDTILVPTERDTRYDILVRTGTVSGAGTDASVYVTLYGANGQNSGEILLDVVGRDDFEAGSDDIFSFMLVNLGEIERVRIRHDNTGDKPGWYLESIEVYSSRSATDPWVFPCHGWLATDEEPRRIDRTLNRQN